MNVIISYILLQLIVLFVVRARAEATEYLVRPTDGEDVSCPGQPCLTINQYSHPSSDYLKLNNTVFTFLPGNHTLERSLQISDIVNITFRGLEGENEATGTFLSMPAHRAR